MQVYGCGSNLFKVLLHGQEDVVDVSTLVEIRPDENVEDIVAVSDSQMLYTSAGLLKISGCDMGIDQEPPADPLSILRGCSIKKVLGKAVFVAVLTMEGYILELTGKKRSGMNRYADAAMDSHGRILALEATSLELRLFHNLDELFSSTFTVLKIDVSPTSETRLHSGAAHFLIHIGRDIVYALGDNRHFQQGHEGHFSWTSAAQISFFEGGSSIKKVVCGNLHTAVLTEDGALYMMGSDAKGQCGGFSEREPALVELELEGDADEQPDVLDVACGSSHTVILTSQGIYATGGNHVGQLGLGHTEDMSKLTRVAIPASQKPVDAIAAHGWNTYFISKG